MRHLTLAAALALALPAQAADLGDDGLHKPDWLRDTFKDLREDLAEANAEGRRLMVIFEQRGCIYCTKMHEEVFPDPEVDALIRAHYFVVQMNLFGDTAVTDFDGATLTEKEAARKWGIMFTPTLMFFPKTVPEGMDAAKAAVAAMPGAFGTGTTSALLTWVRDHGYESGEHFQKFVASRMNPSN
ncbi:thioredoxin family protein [Cereibacter sphaeroides]|uniref:SoxW family protein n=1 Tax=Cereibacter sphaeroides TaxID=1063 RepID=UPI001F2CBCFF|nr:thioredoxin family protein [Cereibacter sphaeroides]MCE6951476.1 thioredoxin family protein [Cereibacter sphaeroides]